MNQTAVEANKRRRRKAKNRKTPGRLIRHSDIVSRRESVQSIAALAPAEEYRGGFKSVVSKTKSYEFSSYHLPMDVGTGGYKLIAGQQTILVQSGQVFFHTTKTVKKEEIEDRGKLQSGESLTVKKGMTVTLTTGHIASGCLLIESGDFEAKQVTPPIKGSTGLEQYRGIRDTVGQDSTTRPARKPKTAAERAELGAKYAASRGVLTGQQQKANKRARQQSRGNNDLPAVIQGSNPQPIGDIG